MRENKIEWPESYNQKNVRIRQTMAKSMNEKAVRIMSRKKYWRAPPTLWFEPGTNLMETQIPLTVFIDSILPAVPLLVMIKLEKLNRFTYNHC